MLKASLSSFKSSDLKAFENLDSSRGFNLHDFTLKKKGQLFEDLDKMLMARQTLQTFATHNPSLLTPIDAIKHKNNSV